MKKNHPNIIYNKICSGGIIEHGSTKQKLFSGVFWDSRATACPSCKKTHKITAEALGIWSSETAFPLVPSCTLSFWPDTFSLQFPSDKSLTTLFSFLFYSTQSTVRFFGESKDKNLCAKGFIIFRLNPVELPLWMTFEITMSVQEVLISSLSVNIQWAEGSKNLH